MYFRKHPTCLTWVVLAMLLPPMSLAAQMPPEWTLALEPAVEIGRSDIQLHRVVGAALLPKGELALADAGNGRVLIISKEGRLVRTVGRPGDGPEEFRSLFSISALADTIIAYDAGLSRVAVYLATGEHVATRSLPGFDGQPTLFRGALTSAWYVVTSPVRPDAVRPGLVLDSTAVLTMDVAAGTVRHVTTREWQYIYTIEQRTEHGSGLSSYGTPFLGQTLVAAVRGRIAIVDRDGSGLEILQQAATSRRLSVPIRPRAFSREVIDSHRDSLIAAANRSPVPFPGAVQRLEAVFGEKFPVPAGEHAPIIQHAVVVGDELWLQSTPGAGDARATWLVMDPRTARLVGSIAIPREWKVLGGSSQAVVISARDEWDVEYVQVYTFTR